MLRAIGLLGDLDRRTRSSSSTDSSDLSSLPPCTPPKDAQSPYFTPPRSGMVTRSTKRVNGGTSLNDDPLSDNTALPPTPVSPLVSSRTKRRKGKGPDVNHIQARPKRSKRLKKTTEIDKPIKLSRSERYKEGHDSSKSSLRKDALLTRSETGKVEPIGKIHLIQERVRHDPWKMLVATCLLNVTSGRAARPIYIELLKRYPTPESLSQASVPDLSELLYPLGLFNQRATSLILFSSQYLVNRWPVHQGTPSSDPFIHPTGPIDHQIDLPENMDVKIFHGAGRYASDSFRIYSDLFPGKGAPEDESKWVEKRKRAMDRFSKAKTGEQAGFESDHRQHMEGVLDGVQENTSIEGEEIAGVEGIGDWLSDDGDVYDAESPQDEWRKVRPTDKELRRYLIWRWGLEGILYDIHKGPLITRESDQRRLTYLL